MKNSLSLTIAIIASSSLLMGSVTFAYAGAKPAAHLAPAQSGGVPSGTVNGTFTAFTDYTVLIGTAGDSKYNSELSGGAYSGELSGAFTDYGTEVVGQGGSLTGWGTELCPVSCTIAGKKGGFTATYYYAGNGETLTFTAGYGDLRGLTGGGTFTYPASGPPTYSYSYKF
jgi:hypothetical protein